MKSMTGFGHEQAQIGNYCVDVEVNAVNRKHLDIQTSLPDTFTALESELRAKVATTIARGRVHLSVVIDRSGEASRNLVIDHDYARSCHRAISRLQQELDLAGPVSIDTMLNISGVLSTDTQPLDADQYGPQIIQMLEHALQQCDTMRLREGASLKTDLQQRQQQLRQIISSIRDKAPDVISHYSKVLQSRLNELHSSLPIDDERLGREVAVYADRCDITEELVRLDSHLDQLTGLLDADGTIGRHLDFLIQEMVREVNTVGSKANDAGISMQVVSAKTELDKMREQIQNVE